VVSALAGTAREVDIASAVAEVLAEDVEKYVPEREPHRAATSAMVWVRSVAAVIDSTQWARCRRRDWMYRRMDVPSTAKTRDSYRSLIPIAAATCPALSPVRSGGPRHKSMRQLGALSLDPRRGVLPGP
jgi:hypothetical protein